MDKTIKTNKPTAKLENSINDGLNRNSHQEINSEFCDIDKKINDIKNRIAKNLSLLGRTL